jgi:hypothetical protein
VACPQTVTKQMISHIFIFGKSVSRFQFLLDVSSRFIFYRRREVAGEEIERKDMTSSVYFKMHHGNEVLAVNFTGHQIKLLDLKRSIMELKNISKGLDFDLKITDAENDQKSLSFVVFFFCSHLFLLQSTRVMILLSRKIQQSL